MKCTLLHPCKQCNFHRLISSEVLQKQVFNSAISLEINQWNVHCFTPAHLFVFIDVWPFSALVFLLTRGSLWIYWRLIGKLMKNQENTHIELQSCVFLRDLTVPNLRTPTSKLIMGIWKIQQFHANVTPDMTLIFIPINTLRPKKDGRHFPDDTFKCIFLNENV